MLKPYAILILLWVLGILLISMLSGCKLQDVKPDTQKEAVSVNVKLPVLAWGEKRADWTEYLLKELRGKEFLAVVPVDFKDYCAEFPALSLNDRAEFYAELISIMAKRESGFNPASKYQEAFNDAKGRPVISRGLLQISIESANSYGCNFKDATELHDPKKNLSCTVKIIERWVNRDKRLGGKVAGKWQGVARYWSVGRSVSRSYAVVTGHTKALKICKN